MFTRFSSSVPTPCAHCDRQLLDVLQVAYKESADEHWVYRCQASKSCRRCAKPVPVLLRPAVCVVDALECFESKFIDFERRADPTTLVEVPIDVSTVGIVERSIHAASTAVKGSDFRSHGTFISHLVTLECTERHKQALCCWAPLAMLAYMQKKEGVSRTLQSGHLSLPDSPPVAPPVMPPPGLPAPEVHLIDSPPANPGTEDGMVGTVVAPDAYGEETRVSGVVGAPPEPKVLARQIGPDLIPCEVMDSCVDNLKAGLAKRVQPLPFKSDKKMIRKIDATVSALLTHVFSKKKIKEWRVNNPIVEEFCSKKWTAERFAQAMEDGLADTGFRIKQTFQIKQNECLPAKGKAPRPIIQCGDTAQVAMALPVKCFEELLFTHFDEASIKHLSKFDAMKRVVKRFKHDKHKLHIVEGDGSAWDACCNGKIRAMTENRILRHIIDVLAGDHEIPKGWFEKVLADMSKEKLRGKAKVQDDCITPIRVVIDAIRQSGHRGTSCFNYLINLIGWLCVLCEDPASMIAKDRGLKEEYVSARDGKTYWLRYCFEGDDSAICTTEDLKVWEKEIEALWTAMGFRMKLVYVKKKMTFTGYDFLVGEHGCTGACIPEIARNVASSSWSCSSELKSFPEKVHSVGAAAMLARAENFAMCGPFARYFAALGLAHVKLGGDLALGENEAVRLGIAAVDSVEERLQNIFDSAVPMDREVRTLVEQLFPISREQELRLLSVDFGDDPFDMATARQVIPFAIWNPKKYEDPRRRFAVW